MSATSAIGAVQTSPLSRSWALAVTVLLSLLLLLLLVTDGNRAVFVAINSSTWPAGAWFWSNVTVLGDTLVLLCLLLPFVGRRPTLLWSFVIALFLVSLLVHGAKFILETPRPPAVLSVDEMHLIGFRAIAGSFPSGHTAAAFVLAGGICLLQFPLGAKLLAVLLAALVGVSRMAVGVHWPLDVLGGALIGWLGMMVSTALAMRWSVGVGLGAQRAIASLLIVATGVTVLFYDGGYPQARTMLMVLPLLLLGTSVPALRRLYGGGNA